MKMVNFEMLLEVASELRCDLYDAVETLAMWDIPMTQAVINIGIIGGRLTLDYANGWSKHLDD